MYGNFCSSKCFFFFFSISVFKKLNQFNWFKIIEIRFLIKSSSDTFFLVFLIEIFMVQIHSSAMMFPKIFKIDDTCYIMIVSIIKLKH